MALESSLIMPIVMMAIILFVCLIRLSAVQMAVHGAASQVARQAAAGMYPAALAAEQAGQYVQSVPNTTVGPAGPAVQIAAEVLETSLPAPAGPMLAAVLQGDWQGAGNEAAGMLGGTVLEPLLKQSADEGLIDPGRLSISRVSLPGLTGDSNGYLTVEVEYDFPLGLPFTKKSITLKESAVERAWLSDSVPAVRGGEDGAGGSQLQIIALEPEPLRPGRQAHLTARAAPGSTVSLTVQYKSGSSRAKHLGEAVAGADGIVEWSWLVSGNTTPGVWELVITAADGTSIAKHFVVEKMT